MAVKVGVVGFGHLGQYLVDAILRHPHMYTLVFVWNRSAHVFDQYPHLQSLVLPDLADFKARGANVIIEVAHPNITRDYGVLFLQAADYIIGSPTIFADRDVEKAMRAEASRDTGFGIHIPSGALWGAIDLQKMDEQRQLKKLKITMKKHPSCFKLLEPLATINSSAFAQPQEVVVFDGSVRDLCPLAPNNVNTMAAAAIAVETLGFDGVQGSIVADSRLDAHIVEIEAIGPSSEGQEPFSVRTVRYNPAKSGSVTGNATYLSFWSSLQHYRALGNGIHFC